MATDPVIELIAQSFVDDITAITVANGFNYDLTAARPTRLGFDDLHLHKDLTVLILQEDPVEESDIAAEGNPPMKAWRQTFILLAYVMESDKTTDPIDTKINRIQADIIKKIKADIKRDDNALDTIVTGTSTGEFENAPGLAGIQIFVDVLYRTSELDPYVNRG